MIADLPTDQNDVLALQRARQESESKPYSYWKFLEALADQPPEILRKKKGPRGEPFSL